MKQNFFRAAKWANSWRVALIGLCLTPNVLVQAAQLTFSYSDPVGDFTGNIDVTSMVVVFDNTTGTYRITLTATAAQPFVNIFRVNVNLFNPNRLPTLSFFQDTGRDYNLSVAQTKLILTGTNPNLLSWLSGDLVATNTLANLGNPPGTTFFRTSVLSFPFGGFLTNEDAVAYGTQGLATITPLTPQGALASVTDDVQVLLETGALTTDQTYGLMDKLTAAISSLNRGDTRPTCGQLKAFINQVSAFMSNGQLTAAQGNGLIQTVEAVTAQIACTY